MWSRYLNVTDGRTDRRTDRETTCRSNTALCAASRGKKHSSKCLSQTSVRGVDVRVEPSSSRHLTILASVAIPTRSFVETSKTELERNPRRTKLRRRPGISAGIKGVLYDRTASVCTQSYCCRSRASQLAVGPYSSSLAVRPSLYAKWRLKRCRSIWTSRGFPVLRSPGLRPSRHAEEELVRRRPIVTGRSQRRADGQARRSIKKSLRLNTGNNGTLLPLIDLLSSSFGRLKMSRAYF